MGRRSGGVRGTSKSPPRSSIKKSTEGLGSVRNYVCGPPLAEPDPVRRFLQLRPFVLERPNRVPAPCAE